MLMLQVGKNQVHTIIPHVHQQRPPQWWHFANEAPGQLVLLDKVAQLKLLANTETCKVMKTEQL